MFALQASSGGAACFVVVFKSRLGGVTPHIMLTYHNLNAFPCPCLTGALYQSSFFSFFTFLITFQRRLVCLFVGGGQGKGQVHSLLLVLLNCTDKCIIFLTTTTVLYLMQVVLFCLCDKPTIWPLFYLFCTLYGICMLRYLACRRL